MARLIAHGWTPEAAASAVGQAVEESRVHSNGARGDSGTAHGLFQWRLDRFAALKAFAGRRDKPWTDFDTQIDFFNEEKKTRSRAERNWHSVKDINAGNVIGKMFERYAGGLQHRRAAHAFRVLSDWNRGAKPTVEAEASASPTPASPSSSDITEFRSWRERMAREGKAPLEEEDDGAVYERWKRQRGGGRAASGNEGERPGDAMMRRFYGQGGSMGTGKGSLHIKLEGAPPGTRVKASMDDLFRKTTVEQGRSQMDMA